MLPPHASHVIVVAAEQHGPGRRAHRRRVKLGENYAIPRQRVDVGRANIAAVNTQIGVAQVVGDDQQDVRLFLTTACRRVCGRGGHSMRGTQDYQCQKCGIAFACIHNSSIMNSVLLEFFQILLNPR